MTPEHVQAWPDTAHACSHRATLPETDMRSHGHVTYWSARRMSQGNQAPAWGGRGKNCCGLLTAPSAASTPPGTSGAGGFSSSPAGTPTGGPLTSGLLSPASLLLPRRGGRPLLQSLPYQDHTWSHLGSPAQAAPPHLECPLFSSLCMKNLLPPSPARLSPSSMCTEASPSPAPHRLCLHSILGGPSSL